MAGKHWMSLQKDDDNGNDDDDAGDDNKDVQGCLGMPSSETRPEFWTLSQTVSVLSYELLLVAWMVFHTVEAILIAIVAMG